MLRHWIITFYCLPYLDLFVLFGLITYAYLRLDHRFHRRRRWKAAVACAAVLWVGVILMFTVTQRETGTTDTVLLIPFHSYREMAATGNIEILRSNFMNAILFYPAGLLTVTLLPEKWPRWLRVLPVFAFFTCCSIGVEYFQYAFSAGRAEIDDVLHNGAGALVGAVFGVIPFFRSQEERG